MRPPGGGQTFERNLGLAVMGGVLVFTVWPILAVILESLRADGAFDPGAYLSLFTGKKPLIANTLLTACLTAILSVTMGLAIALFLTRTKNQIGRASCRERV